MDGLTSKYMETIERLQSDKARLEVRMRWRMINSPTVSFNGVNCEVCIFYSLLTGEGTDSGEGSQRVQVANR